MKKIILAAAVLWATPSWANFDTGNDLHNNCQNYRMSAVSYVMGAVDAMATAQNNGLVERRFCIRDGVTGRQATDIVCQYLGDNPAFRDFNATPLISVALEQAFPCQ